MPEGRITDEALKQFGKRVGKTLRVRPYNEVATKDNIRKFADGIGDPNQLWRDEAYAKDTRYKRIVAPPSWPYSVFPTWVLQGLPGVHAYHSGNDWEFYKPVLMNDMITPQSVFTGFDEKMSKFSGRVVWEYQDALYYNQRGELVAKAKSWLARAERRASRETGKYRMLQLPHSWSTEELWKIEEASIRSHYDDIRGSKIRYWEDVKVEEELPSLIKGPLNFFDMVSFTAGAGPVPIVAHGVALNLFHKHPAWGFRDPETHALIPIYSVHFLPGAAKSAGNPYAFDVGVQRNSWLIQMLTNWMGDDGWLKRCYANYRRFAYLSDVLWIKGKITEKYVGEDGEYTVNIETSALNQRGEETMPGKATIVLPSRTEKSWPVEKRLPEK
jgi:acyl dehydratase